MNNSNIDIILKHLTLYYTDYMKYNIGSNISVIYNKTDNKHIIYKNKQIILNIVYFPSTPHTEIYERYKQYTCGEVQYDNDLQIRIVNIGNHTKDIMIIGDGYIDLYDPTNDHTIEELLLMPECIIPLYNTSKQVLLSDSSFIELTYKHDECWNDILTIMEEYNAKHNQYIEVYI